MTTGQTDKVGLFIFSQEPPAYINTNPLTWWKVITCHISATADSDTQHSSIWAFQQHPYHQKESVLKLTKLSAAVV